MEHKLQVNGTWQKLPIKQGSIYIEGSGTVRITTSDTAPSDTVIGAPYHHYQEPRAIETLKDTEFMWVKTLGNNEVTLMANEGFL